MYVESIYVHLGSVYTSVYITRTCARSQIKIFRDVQNVNYDSNKRIKGIVYISDIFGHNTVHDSVNKQLRFFCPSIVHRKNIVLLTNSEEHIENLFNFSFRLPFDFQYPKNELQHVLTLFQISLSIGCVPHTITVENGSNELNKVFRLSQCYIFLCS